MITRPTLFYSVFMNSRFLISALFLCGALGSTASGQVGFDGPSYRQTFDELELNETQRVRVMNFRDNQTLRGWYASTGTNLQEARASHGPATTSGLLYNWGEIGSTDRALGLFSPAGFERTEHLGVQLRNDTGRMISRVRLAYVMEQWRRNAHPFTWRLSYQVTAAGDNRLVANGYAEVPAGAVTSPHLGSASALRGNSPANQVGRELELDAMDWAPGTYLWLRWSTEFPAGAGALALEDFLLEVR